VLGSSLHKLSVRGAVGSNRRRRLLFRTVIDYEPQPGPLSRSIASNPRVRDPFRQLNNAPDRYGDALRIGKRGNLKRIVRQTVANPGRRPVEDGGSFGDAHGGSVRTQMVIVVKRLAHDDAPVWITPILGAGNVRN
jgi:hypothetical protein